MQVLILLTGIIDLFGLAVFVPILSAIANPEIINSTPLFHSIKNFFAIDSTNNFLLLLFIIAFCFFLFRSAFVLFSQWVQSKFVFQLSEYIGQKTYQYYMNVDYQLFQKKNAAEIIRELTISPQFFSRFIVMPLFLLVSEFFITALVVGGIALYDIKVFLLLIVTVFPVAFVFNKLVKKRLKFYGEEQNRLTPKLYSNSNRGIYGFIDVKLRNKEHVLTDDYSSVFQKLNKINVVTTVLNVFPSKLFELVTVAGLLVIFIYGAFWAANPAIVIPLIAIYAAAGYRIIPSLSKIIPGLMQLNQYSYLFKVFEQPLKYQASSVVNELEKIELLQEIRMNELSFAFSESTKNIIENFNITIKKGEIIGLIGKSGSGKSTLVKIIAGFLKPSKGVLMVDGRVIDDNTIRSWMNQISFVQQSPYLEKGSLVTNIAFLEQNPDISRVNKVIEMASLSTLLDGKSPAEIMIDEDGKNLSGGQKQRIVIARALYNNSKLIIFDEATSALDNETEEEVNETIKKLKGTGVTIIIIAHRYSTLVHTDRIIELSEKASFIESNYQTLQHN
ncbi:MAG: ABC transporter ATP-binding protein [Bacteroidia bacterium]|nr:ABC transporter ATP-binding protein [Bacteroidia bacterium]